LIYCPLESLSSIPEAEAYEQILKQSKGCDDGSFRYVGGGDGYLMVSFDLVDLAEDVAAVQAVGQVLHVWEGVPVRGGDSVEAAVVAAGRQEPSFLGTLCRGDAHAEFDRLMIPAF
jgi:hypothetical protein